MEEAVSDAFTLKTSKDRVLKSLIEVGTVSVIDKRPIFSNPLHEPILWRHFVGWVSDGIAAASKIEAILEKAAKIPGR